MKLVFDFPKEVVDKPIITQIIKKFDVTVNILRGKVDKDAGELVVDISGERVDEAIQYLRTTGVVVMPITKRVFFDADKCISCGACISLCPNALYFDENWKIQFDDNKCILCKACIKACPIQVIRIK